MFFDNVQVIHTKGQILEETHYYPFGLTMAGISSKAAGSLENKKSKYNGYELTTDFDLSLYESFYRTHDPQIGRFLQIDPKPIYEESPFTAMGNNPIKYNDLLGDKYKLEGKDEDKKKYLEYLSSLTGNTYELNKKGEVVRTNKKLNTKTTDKKSGTLSKIVEKGIKSKETTTLNLKNDPETDKAAGMDIAASKTVDMKDMAKLKEFSDDNKENALFAGVVGHFLNELQEIQNGKSIAEAHTASEKIDGQIVTEMLKIPNITRTQIGNRTLDYGQVQYTIPYKASEVHRNGLVIKSVTYEIIGRIIKVDNPK